MFGFGEVQVEVGAGEVGFLPLVCAAAADEDLVEDVEQELVAAGVAVGAGDGDAAGVKFAGVGDGSDGGAVVGAGIGQVVPFGR